ncbi:MAG: HlyC/CorC family transporter [Tissierellia bacterium]|nr:HlyC/CorC family transporter [Tissierellia bacterium]
MGEVVTIIILLMLSAFFSASEIAYSSINKVRLETMQDGKNKRAAMAYFIYSNYERALATILVGNNLVNIGASTMATALAIELVGAKAVSASAAIMTILVLIFGEITPKIVASKHSLTLALFASYPLRVFMFIFKPVLFITEPLIGLVRRRFKGEELDPEEQSEAVEEELVSLLETVENEGIIDENRKNIISSALDFTERSVSEILIPRVDLFAIDLDDEREEILEQIQASPYTRIPVYEKSIDNIVGILYLNQFYRMIIDEPDLCIRDILRPASYFYKTTKLPAALEMLRSSQMHLGVVTDDYGGNIGIVTIEDIMETLVGEIWDETDEVYDEIVKINETTFELDGDVAIQDLFDLLGWDEDEFDIDSDTVGGWCIEETQGYPQAGDFFNYENIQVTVLTMDNMRVDRLRIDILTSEKE